MRFPHFRDISTSMRVFGTRHDSLSVQRFLGTQRASAASGAETWNVKNLNYGANDFPTAEFTTPCMRGSAWNRKHAVLKQPKKAFDLSRLSAELVCLSTIADLHPSLTMPDQTALPSAI